MANGKRNQQRITACLGSRSIDAMIIHRGDNIFRCNQQYLTRRVAEAKRSDIDLAFIVSPHHICSTFFYYLSSKFQNLMFRSPVSLSSRQGVNLSTNNTFVLVIQPLGRLCSSSRMYISTRSLSMLSNSPKSVPYISEHRIYHPKPIPATESLNTALSTHSACFLSTSQSYVKTPSYS